MEFDLWRIIIRNDFEIIIVMIIKRPILRKLVSMKYRH